MSRRKEAERKIKRTDEEVDSIRVDREGRNSVLNVEDSQRSMFLAARHVKKKEKVSGVFSSRRRPLF